MKLKIISIFVLFVTSSLINSSKAQIVWSTEFEIENKGIWADSTGVLHSDLIGVDWTVEANNCDFVDEKDYAKTVSTNGGRFEVLDSDGDVYWKSPMIYTADNQLLSLSFQANETGSSAVENKKFVRYYLMLNGEKFTSESDSMVAGNWGDYTFQLTSIRCDSLQLVVVLNSSYASDKVYIDQIKIETTDPALLAPAKIKTISVPNVVFLSDTFEISAAIYNGYDELILDDAYQIRLASENIDVINSSFEEGVYRWKLLASELGNYVLKIAPIGFEVETILASIYIIEKSTLQFDANFESNAENWKLGNDWIRSDVEPINGNYSIQHNDTSLNGFSSLALNIETIDFESGNFQFGMCVKIDDWNPSSSNNFYFELSNGGNGYAIGVNANGTTDLLSMWEIDNGEIGDLVVETDFLWIEFTSAEIQLFRSFTGDWTLMAIDSLGTKLGEGTGFDNDVVLIDTQKFHFKYSKTRAGLIWFDDFRIIKIDIPPQIKEVTPIDFKTVQVQFNEPVDTNFVANNFEIWNEGEMCEISSLSIQTSTILELEFLPRNTYRYQLIVHSVSDLEANTSTDLQVDFLQVLPPNEGEIVINEIMADPNPSVGLPSVEYIELLNTSNAFLTITEGELLVRDVKKTLPSTILPPGAFALICDEDDIHLFEGVEQYIPLATMPALLNSGVRLSFIVNNQVIDQIEYAENWYHNELKSDGGFSIERMDPTRNCGQYWNWKASENELGGTPGKQNSVYASNIDLVSPTILNCIIVSNKRIEIEFDEPIDTLNWKNNSENFRFSPELTVNNVNFSDANKKVFFQLNGVLKEDQDYLIDLKNISDECGNRVSAMETNFVWHHIEPGDVFISEILFNPVAYGADFVEIYNATDYSVDISKLRIATRDDSLNLKSIYPLENQPMGLNPKSYLAITKDTVQLISQFNIAKTNNLVQVAILPLFNNDKGRVVLLNDSLEVIDEFVYTEDMHNRFVNDNESVSLERISFLVNTNDVENWTSSSNFYFATPGAENSQSGEVQSTVEMTFNAEVVSPNFDNYNDALEIQFKLDQPQYLANIYLFNVIGQQIRQLKNNELIGNRSVYIFDCYNDNGEQLRSGAYFILAELIGENGEKLQFKKAFYLTNGF